MRTVVFRLRPEEERCLPPTWEVRDAASAPDTPPVENGKRRTPDGSSPLDAQSR